MSKVQGKDTDLLNNLADNGIAKELDSRLRDLEKNIAVAREFIKLADESYSELRHKWNLLQEKAGERAAASTIEKTTTITTKRSARSSKQHFTLREEPLEMETEKLEVETREPTDHRSSTPHSDRSSKSSKAAKDSAEQPDSHDQAKNAKRSPHAERKAARSAR